RICVLWRSLGGRTWERPGPSVEIYCRKKSVGALEPQGPTAKTRTQAVKPPGRSAAPAPVGAPRAVSPTRSDPPGTVPACSRYLVAPGTAGQPTTAVPPDTIPLTLGAEGGPVHGRARPMDNGKSGD